ncbi:IS110 family transposase [Alloalcanivorax gelatiniphagus]|uniref:IS110 family transposase n=2 Tax=Alloalcanivorax gelatiniphagus TaxID=1194167 RepID=A0ABY2XFG5_9GAMM|nr:IS110 family transposase [Alloalcanivorax gelatiniphagus]TMW10278.1 IS110 family transposase [Alloalcanivorax gelatiniphagus]
MAYIGIDVSKSKLDLCWLRENGKVKTKVFTNHPKHFPALIDWLTRQTGEQARDLRVYLEATGIYHEPVAEWLHEVGAQVHVVNPAQVRHYGHALGHSGKTDKKDSQLLARYGLDRQPPRWQPEPAAIRRLRRLAGRLETVQQDIQREENRREKAMFSRDTETVSSIDQVLLALQGEAKRLREEIKEHIDGDGDLKRDQALLESIPGIGEVTSVHLMVLLRGKTFRSARQAAAFVGLVPCEWTSGSSVRGRPRLTKKGSPAMRRRLYMAALTASRHNPVIQGFYTRLRQAGKTPMSALTAAMRKLMHIAFGVLHRQTPFQTQPVGG